MQSHLVFHKNVPLSDNFVDYVKFNDASWRDNKSVWKDFSLQQNLMQIVLPHALLYIYIYKVPV